MLYREELFFAFLRELLHLLFREDVAESCHGWFEFFFNQYLFRFLKAVARPERVKEEGKCPDWMAECPVSTDPTGRRRRSFAPRTYRGRLNLFLLFSYIPRIAAPQGYV